MGYCGSGHQEGTVQHEAALLTPLRLIRASLWGGDGICHRWPWDPSAFLSLHKAMTSLSGAVIASFWITPLKFSEFLSQLCS